MEKKKNRLLTFQRSAFASSLFFILFCFFLLFSSHPKLTVAVMNVVQLDDSKHSDPLPF